MVGKLSAPPRLNHQYRRSGAPRSTRRNTATAPIGPRGPRWRTAQRVAEGFSDAAVRLRGGARPAARPRAGWTASPAIAIGVSDSASAAISGQECPPSPLTASLKHRTPMYCKDVIFGARSQAIYLGASAMPENRSSNRASRAKG